MKKTIFNFQFSIFNRRGQAALELLIALAVLAITATAALTITFGNQSTGVDTETNTEALHIAGDELEEARAIFKENFNATPPTPAAHPLYTTLLNVVDLTQCKKQVTSETTWNVSALRSQKTSLSTVFSDIAGALELGGDCGSDGPGGPWDSPATYEFAEVVHPGSAGTDVDVIKRADGRFVLLTTEKEPGKETLWMIDVTTPEDETSVVLTDSYDAAYDNGDELFAVDAIDDYAFAAGAATDQLWIINITDQTNLSLAAAATLPDAPTGIGRSIYYYGNRVYFGTQYLPCPLCSPEQNNELHIFNVTDPNNPLWEASIDVDRNVNDIMVRDGLAYVAIGPGGTGDILRVYDVDPASGTYLQEVGNFVAPGGEQGTALYLIGNKVYLGREQTPSARHDFYILDVTNPASVSKIWSGWLDVSNNSEVVGIHVSGVLAFISTSDQTPANGGGPFMVFDVSDPTAPSQLTLCSFNYPESTSGMDSIDGLIFTSNESNDAMRIIYPALSCS